MSNSVAQETTQVSSTVVGAAFSDSPKGKQNKTTLCQIWTNGQIKT